MMIRKQKTNVQDLFTNYETKYGLAKVDIDKQF